jgi:NAD(P)H-hydrate epimerase
MAANAAIRSGGGLVTLGIPQTLLSIMASQVIEAMTVPLPDDGTGMLTLAAEKTIAHALADKRVLAIGPGIGTAPATRQLVHHIARTCKLPLVIDADGLNTLAGHLALLAERDAATVLTPHPGEMARLLDCSVASVQQDRLAAARELARLSRACVVLKGARTLICDVDGQVWINTTGNPGMASGGMGDVLTGAVGGWLAQGCSPVHAAIVAVFLHGLAADMLAKQTPWGYTATDVMNVLPQALYRVLKEPPAAPIHGPGL